MPLLTARQHGFIGLALVLLLVVTRGQHWAGVSIPSATWAVFFLGGLLLSKARYYGGLMLVVVGLDALTLSTRESFTHWCLTSAYWALFPAYASLWLGGVLYRRWHAFSVNALPALLVCVLVSAFIGYVFSGGGFYFFSGRYPEPALDGFLPRIAEYYPRHLSNMALYLVLAAVVGVTAMLWRRLVSQEVVSHG